MFIGAEYTIHTTSISLNYFAAILDAVAVQTAAERDEREEREGVEEAAAAAAALCTSVSGNYCAVCVCVCEERPQSQNFRLLCLLQFS